jgi:hypothetical protein
LLCFQIICTLYGDCLKGTQTGQIAGGVLRLTFLGRFLRVNVFQRAKKLRANWDLAAQVLGATVRDEDDLKYHLNYVHFNPVKHGLVSRVSDWPHPKFHEYVRRGVYTLDCGDCDYLLEQGFGE